jgi:hypothetical protein
MNLNFYKDIETSFCLYYYNRNLFYLPQVTSMCFLKFSSSMLGKSPL